MDKVTAIRQREQGEQTTRLRLDGRRLIFELHAQRVLPLDRYDGVAGDILTDERFVKVEVAPE